MSILFLTFWTSHVAVDSLGLSNSKGIEIYLVQPPALVTPVPSTIDTPIGIRLRDLTELFNQGLINEKDFL